MKGRIALFCTVLALASAFGCQTAQYKILEGFGIEKRHLLKDNVEDARSEQEKASEEFKDALTRVKEIYGYQGGDLEEMYDRLRDDYEACESRAEAVDERIQKVERIANDLFEEWRLEIEQINNPKFKTNSKKKLMETKGRYARLNRAMVKAHKRMEPALGHLRDYVLYVKHNLNAQAIGALKEEVESIQTEVETLIGDISVSIREADAFIKTLE